MLQNAQTIGRDNPVAFLSAAAAAGFAVGRFMRAGAEQHNDIGFVKPNTNDEFGHPANAETQTSATYENAPAGSSF